MRQKSVERRENLKTQIPKKDETFWYPKKEKNYDDFSSRISRLSITKRDIPENTRKKQNPQLNTNNNGEEEETTLRRAEEEEEEGERRCSGGGSGGYGAFEARTDEDMDGVGVASQGCVRLACLVEIEYDRSVFLFEGE